MTARDWATPLRLFAAALVIRALPFASVYAEDTVFLRGADSYYHLRRILYAIRNFPDALVFDPYVQFPHGAKIIWPPLLDSVFAALLWPVAQFGGLALAERMAPWLPPLLGAATVVATWQVARRHFGDTQALLAGGLLSILGGHFVYSRLGALDHHVAVSLLSILLLGSVLRALECASSGSIRRPAIAVGVLAGLSLLVWPGAILYSSLALAGLAGAALFESDRSKATDHWGSLALAAAIACVVVAPFCLGAEWPQWNSMTPVVLTNFQPWFFGSAAALALATAIGGGKLRLGEGRGGRATIAFGAGALVLAASVALSGDLREGFADAWRWLGKGEEFQASVIESQSLFVVRNKVSTFMANQQLSYLLYLFPALWVFGWIEARRSSKPGPWVFLLVWSGALCAVTLMQKRFLDTFSVAFALTTSVSAIAFWRRHGAAPGSLATRLALAGVVLALIPLHRNYGTHFDNLIRGLQDEPLKLSVIHRANRVLHGVGEWIRAYTPRTAGWLSTSQEPEYGIMAAWSHGHILRQVARRPTIVDNFGDDAGAENYAIERRFWKVTTLEASAILDELGARYVVVTDGDPHARYWRYNSTYQALLLRDGSGVVRGPGKASARAAGRYRLLMESQPLSERVDRPYAKVFEHVEGARIVGRTTPGARIRLVLPLETNRERSFRYHDRVTADEEGIFTFRVPYATEGGPVTVKTRSAYSLRCGAKRVWVAVPEPAVLTGRTLEADDPCVGEPTKPARPTGRRPRR